MELNWEAIGAIGEIVGALAVVVTLIFLLIQIRHTSRSMDENSRLTKANIMKRAGDSISEFGYILGQDSQTALVWKQGCSGEPLGEAEYAQFFWLVRNFIGLTSSAYYDYLSVGDDVSREGNARILARMISSNPGVRQIWDEMRRNALTELGRTEFIETVGNYMSIGSSNEQSDA